jgi:hypothetical protein
MVRLVVAVRVEPTLVWGRFLAHKGALFGCVVDADLLKAANVTSEPGLTENRAGFAVEPFGGDACKANSAADESTVDPEIAAIDSDDVAAVAVPEHGVLALASGCDATALAFAFAFTSLTFTFAFTLFTFTFAFAPCTLALAPISVITDAAVEPTPRDDGKQYEETGDREVPAPHGRADPGFVHGSSFPARLGSVTCRADPCSARWR